MRVNKKLTIETGHSVTADIRPVNDDRVRFVIGGLGGKTLFEVSACADGHSIEVRSVESFKLDNVIYDTQIVVEPNVSNCITIRTKRWRD